ncbi:hypothetical protein MM300_10045 [Evansella sp. LMS18]|uniref:hypothetical protein n=1 Tax=Evansella sp. LMS18 TaxID=2924033 RepID=UPI0020D1DC69|nr:hypothetical protein [Evansella sp. LMS18]UTR12578.1 hypothetical protein MM300_10045 [Evansella sp. LMS18]
MDFTDIHKYGPSAEKPAVPNMISSAGQERGYQKKSVQQIISKLQGQGVHAELCKRNKFSPEQTDWP